MREPRTAALIAIVDDDAAVRRALGRVMRGAGYAVEVHASGQALLDSLAHATPDCILLDVNMPGLDGFDVHSELSQRGYSIPVIFITANQEPRMKHRAASVGAAAFIDKPVESAVLLEAIAAALQRGS
jgi:two-component system response regulator FixJ